MAGTLSGMETAIGQIGFMLVNVGTAVSAIAHAINNGQQVEAQWGAMRMQQAAAAAAASQAAGSGAGQAASSASGHPEHFGAAQQPPPPQATFGTEPDLPAQMPPTPTQIHEIDQGGDPWHTTTTTTTEQTATITPTSNLAPIPEQGLESWEILSNSSGPIV
eukprot:3400467-Pyramimonas_sp.AAC.1